MSGGNLQKISEDILFFIDGATSLPGAFMPNEETITELLLVDLKRLLPRTSVIQKPNKHQESREGHDWVWTVRTKHGYGTMRVQAKKLYDSGDYKALNHYYGQAKEASVELQLERLINTARSQNHVPIYAFYNGRFGVFKQSPVELGGCCRSPLQRDQGQSANYSPMGVTLTDAHWVQYLMQPDKTRTSIPSVPGTDKLNQAVIPWECLLSCTSCGSPIVPDPSPTGSNGEDSRPKDSTVDGRSDKTESHGESVGSAGSGKGPEMQDYSRSFLRKLRDFLQTGESRVSRNDAILTGFSEEPPAWMEGLVVRETGEWRDNLENSDIIYERLEPDLEEEQRPNFYVYSDARELAERTSVPQVVLRFK